MLDRIPPLWALFLFGALASAFLCAAMPVFSQEAYYWTYAQRPDLSYYDHPPMVAWLIWLGTAVFGDGAFGIRFGTWLCGLGTAWSGVLLLRDFGVDARGQSLWLLVGMGSPILVVAHVLANPDPPLVLFFTVTMLALWRARQGGTRWWILAGAAAGAALLSKYTAAFLAMAGLVMLLLDAPLRRQLRSRGPYLGVLVAVLVFLPVIVWNVRNQFESFRFQTSHRFAEGALTWRWFAELVGGQFGLLNPLLAVLLPAAAIWLARRAWKHDSRALLLLAFGLPLPTYMVVQSFWIQVKLNWLTPAYVPLLIGLALWWRESDAATRRPRMLRAALVTILLLQAVIPLAPLIRMMPPRSGTSWTGWSQIAERAEAWEDRIDPIDGIEGNCFFFAPDYRDAAQLGRNVLLLRRAENEAEHPDHGSIEFEPTMAQNVVGEPALQYDHWSPPLDRIGQDAILVLPRPEGRGHFVARAESYFDRVEKVERVSVERLGIHLLDADIYVCRGYRGPGHR